MANVLVTDGNQRAALAVTRSLGSKGIRVITADVLPKTLSSASKHAYSSETYLPHDDIPAFIKSIKDIVSRHNIQVIIPITEISLFSLLQHRNEFPSAVMPFDSYEKISLLSDKAKLIEHCTKLDISCPKSLYFESGSEAIHTDLSLEFPIVLKPYRSRIFENDHWISTSVKYAHTEEEFRNMCMNDPVFSSHPFMIQEYIEGFGQGIFLLFDHGKPIATFCHKRLREKPPTGGVSVLCESTAAPEALSKMAVDLLSSVQWHGVAMVEFKVNEHRGPFIMEVNTRFWGSLQLAIDAGVDFPYLLYKLSQNVPLTHESNYKKNQRLRWLLGDLDRLYFILKSNNYSIKNKLIEFVSFISLSGKGLRYEINRLNDFNPFWEELRQYFSHSFRRRN